MAGLLDLMPNISGQIEKDMDNICEIKNEHLQVNSLDFLYAIHENGPAYQSIPGGLLLR